MATNPQSKPNGMFAPPTREELSAPPAGMFAPPREEELFAPPRKEELLPQSAKTEAPPPPEMLREEDFQRIGKEFGVSPNELRSLAPYYGVRVGPSTLSEAAEVGAKSAAGTLGRTAGFGLPQHIYKKLQSEPMRKALDELNRISREQQSFGELAGEIAMPGGAIASTAKKAAPRIIGAATTGGLYGLTGSEEGKETEAAGKGALIGTGLGSGLELFGAALRKLSPSKIESQLAEQQARTGQIDIGKGAEEVAARTEKSENLLDDLIFRQKESLSRADIDVLMKEQIGEDSVARYMDPMSEEGSWIRRRIEGPVTEQSIRGALVDDLLDTRARDFAQDLTGKLPKTGEEALGDIQKFASRQGEEATSNRYRDYLQSKQAEKYLSETGARAVDEPTFFGKALNFLSDNQFVFRNIDDRFGTKLEETVRDLNKSFNRSTFALQKFRNDYDQVFQVARKNGSDDAVVGTDKLYRAMDSGNLAGLSDAEKQTVGEFTKYFAQVRDFVNGLVKEKDPRIAPLSIPKHENYVPHMLKSTPELVSALEKKLDQVLLEASQQAGKKISDLSQLNPQQYRALATTEDMKDLIRAVNLFDEKEIAGAADLSSKLKQMMYSREGNVALESAARAALERKGEIPNFLRETNLYKLARRYTDNTLRHLYLRNGIDKLRYQAKSLQKAGADADATYVNNLIRDILGVRKGTAAEAMLRTRINASRKLDSLIEKYGKDSVRGHALTLVKSFPDMLSFTTRQIYPNVLGYWNLRAAIQNATSAITKVAPELGGAYGYTTTLRGAVYTLGNIRRLIQKAEQLGNVPAEFVRKGERAIAEGVARSAGVQLSRDALEAVGKAGMKLYQWVENFNRALALGVGEVMARDLARGSNLALGSLRKFPRPVQKAVLDNRGNPEAAAEILGKYLNDTTQYNYNKISMSEFGRTMGPFFSTFSKWPTATVGDILYEMRDKGVLGSIPRNMEKYIAPFVLLQSLDYLLGERIGDLESLTPEQKKLLGSAGLSQSAPIGSVAAIAKGEIFTPPFVDALVQAFVVPVIEGDVGKLEKGAGALVGSYVPGAGILRFVTDDLVTYLTGERPEGSNFIERTVEGAERITK